ncbi:hypothetical protein [Novosphingobium sp. UBA1939]|uniref:hypothetical protein n=1 Tax=Novosphingobium sp. UBA1939 TaxID=1946982 RepID=UPI0025E88539|nr:hypothetical protein [Novosphingobium sp. UBA1939]
MNGPGFKAAIPGRGLLPTTGAIRGGTTAGGISGFGWPTVVRAVLVWLVLCVILFTATRTAIATMRFADPDDALRLLEVRDLLGGQNWFDVHQYRVAAPEGVPMHWSRLVDIPIAGLILLLRPLVGAAGAETVALVAVPLLTLLCALLLIARLAVRLFDQEVAGIACLVGAIASPVLFQFMPMRIDHHGWQIVLALAAFNGLTARDARRGGTVVGLALAAQLAISIEGLPVAALFLGVCALRGLRNPGERHAWLAHAATALALGSIALFLGTRGLLDPINHCDAISPVHLAVFVWGAIGANALRLAAPRPLVLQIGALAVIGAGALGLLLLVAPQCGTGAFAEMDPVVRKYWYSAVKEGLPVWNMPPLNAVTMIFTPLFGLLATAWYWRRASSAPERLLWLDLLLVLLGAYGVGLLVARASGTACVFAAVPVAALVRDGITALRTRGVSARIAGYAAAAVVLLPALPVFLWNAWSPAGHDKPDTAFHVTRCQYAQAARALDRLPPTDLFAPLDIGPNLLVYSRHRVIATGHHRGSAAMRDVIDAFIGTPEQAHAIVRRRHATMVVLCPDINEPQYYADAAPDGLAARLLKGKPPAWLQPIDPAPGSHLRFWRVVD